MGDDEQTPGIGDDEQDPDGFDGATPATEESDGNVAGPFSPADAVEPGRPAVENALFVIVGAYVAVLLVIRIFIAPGGIGARNLLVLTGVAALLALLAAGYYGLLDPDT